MRTMFRSVLAAGVPSGIRNRVRVRRLKEEFGFTHVGSDESYRIVQSKFGRNCKIGSRVAISNSEIGDFSYVERGAQIDDTTIGKFCSIAPYALIGASEHPTREFVSTHPFFYAEKPQYSYAADRPYYEMQKRTIIGNDVWIAAGACIKTGVAVGHGAIIGACSVVTKDVPDYAIVAGVPARVLRFRFEEEDIRFLLESRWWDFDAEWLRKHFRSFHNVSSLRNALGAHNGAEVAGYDR